MRCLIKKKIFFFLSGTEIVNLGKLICLSFWGLRVLSHLQISSSCDDTEWNWNLPCKSWKTPSASVRLNQISPIFHLKIESRALKCSLWCRRMAKRRGAASSKTTASRRVPFELPAGNVVPAGHLDARTTQGNWFSFILRSDRHLFIIERDGDWVCWWPCSSGAFSWMIVSSKLPSPCRRDVRVRPSVGNERQIVEKELEIKAGERETLKQGFSHF